MPLSTDEYTPLMADGQHQKSPRCRRYLTATIDTHHADLPLLACCFVTGIIDAGAYNAWGTFMGMQTGTHSGRTMVLYFIH